MIASAKSKSMDDRLKALKSFQQLICVAAAAVLAFAVTSDQSKEYRAALDELGYYRKVNLNDYPLYAEKQFNAERDSDRALLLKAIKRAHLKAQKSLTVNESVIMDFPSTGLQRLRDFESFVTSRHTLGVYMVDDEQEVADQLTAQLKEKTQPSAARPQPVPQQPATQSPVPWTVTSIYASVSSVMAVNNVSMADPVVLHNSPNRESLQFLLYNGLPLPPSLNFSVSCRYKISDSQKPAFDWLRSDENGKHLIDPASGVVFPKMRPFWERIEDMGADNAALFLQERIEASTHGSLSLFGVSVDRDLILLAGPAALFALMLFFLLHLKQVNAPVTWDKHELESAKDYPWLACFPDQWSSATTYGCLVGLPIGSSLFLLLRKNEGWEESATYWGVGFTVALIVLGIFIALAIRRFRKHLREVQTPSEALLKDDGETV
jgi:hypothetical protein